MGKPKAVRFSVFDILKKGIGSSSSHTLAPWLAARECYGLIQDHLKSITAVEVELFGSLAWVGPGHYTSLAIPLGLLGHEPADFDINEKLYDALGIHDLRDLPSLSSLSYQGDPTVDPYTIDYHLRYRTDKPTKREKMVFTFTLKPDHEADQGDRGTESHTYYSYGGGSYGQEKKPSPVYGNLKLKPDYHGAAELLDQARGSSLSEVIFGHEVRFARYRSRHPKRFENLPTEESQIAPYVRDLAVQMGTRIFRGLTHAENDVGYAAMYAKKRAKRIFAGLFPEEALDGRPWDRFLRGVGHRGKKLDFDHRSSLIAAFALAVGEQNAALKNVVTAPTNGACGVVPAVLYHYVLFHASAKEKNWLFDDDWPPNTPGPEHNGICRFLLAASAVGGIIKANANIAGGLGGCQAEIGTASAMAAGGLTEALDGSAEKVFQAAEAALEAHLGLTCDPIGGLVEIPCIGRNLTAAMTAISVAGETLALDQAFEPVVPFDIAVATMENISKRMKPAYKETSRGGLAKTMRKDVRKKRPDLFHPDGAAVGKGEISVFHTTC